MDIRLRFALAAMGLAVYAVVSYRLMSVAPESLWSIGTVLGPMIVASLAGVWNIGHRALALLLAVGTAWLAWSFSQGMQSFSTAWIYLAQHAGIHLALGLWFGGTLRPGRTPLITQFARRVHASMPADMVLYTRQITLAWTLYFLAMTGASVALFVLGRFEQWTFFANILTPVSLVVMFVGEHVVRYRLHPDFERVRMVDAVRAYAQVSQVPRAAPAAEERR